MKKYQPFTDATGIDLHPSAGVDTSIYRDEWRGVSPAVEIVTAEFDELQEARALADAEQPEQLDFLLAG